MSTQGTPGLPCVSLFIYLGTPKSGGVSHMLPSQVEEGEAGGDQEVAPIGICRRTQRLSSTTCPLKSCSLAFHGLGSWPPSTHRYYRMTRGCPGSQISALSTLPTVCMVTRAISLSPHPAPSTPRDLSLTTSQRHLENRQSLVNQDSFTGCALGPGPVAVF